MKFTLEIELGNAAMQSAGDVGRKLVEVSKRIGHGRPMASSGDGRIHDDNGNTVGSWHFTPDGV